MDLQQFSLVLIGIIVLIILYSLIGNFFQHRHIHLLHETGIGIIIGFFFGGLLYFFNDISKVDFDQQIFFYGLLPPMIFAGGYNLKKKDFGKNFKFILIYGLAGTITSFGIVFGLTALINNLHWIVPLRSQNHIQHLETTLMIKYSATISATDSVAALTLIKASEFPKIFSIIFGEGMVNDAVAIILFKVVGGIFDKLDEGGMSPSETIKQILGSFLQTIIYSVLIGVLSAVICSFMFRKFRFLVESEVVQVVLTYLFGILSYVAAEYFDLSGVITVLICGVVMAHFNFYNLTVGGMHATAYITFQSISFIAEAIVFVYLGVSTIYYLTTEVISFTFLGLQLLICVISRFTAIFGLSKLFSLIYKKKWTVSNSQLSIVSIAGTIRGSVAFALILTIKDDEHPDQVSVIKSTTLMMVCLTTIILGGLMPKFIKIFLGKKDPLPAERLQSIQTTESIPKEEQDILVLKQQQQATKSQKKAGFFKYSDQNYWRPFLIWNYAERKEEINKYKKMMKYNSRGEYEGGNFNALVMRNADSSQINQFVSQIEEKDKQKGLSQPLIEEQEQDQD